MQRLLGLLMLLMGIGLLVYQLVWASQLLCICPLPAGMVGRCDCPGDLRLYFVFFGFLFLLVGSAMFFLSYRSNNHGTTS